MNLLALQRQHWRRTVLPGQPQPLKVFLTSRSVFAHIHVFSPFIGPAQFSFGCSQVFTPDSERVRTKADTMH